MQQEGMMIGRMEIPHVQAHFAIRVTVRNGRAVLYHTSPIGLKYFAFNGMKASCAHNIYTNTLS